MARALFLGLAVVLAFAGCSDDGDRTPGGGGGTDSGGDDAGDQTDAGDVDAGPPGPRDTEVILGPGATEEDRALFDGPEDSSLTPDLLYPTDGTMVPPNLNELEFHYMPGGGDVFELTFAGAFTDVKVYFTCESLGSGCVYTPDEAVWTLLSDNERGRNPVTYWIRAARRGTPGVGESVRQQITFAEEDITGGLYYWNAGAGAVRRYDFGLRGQSAENYIDGPRAGAFTCVGCHTLSRDGSRIAVGMDIPAPSPYKVYEVGTRTEIYQMGSMFGGGANFNAFSPDATQIMTSNGIFIDLRDASSGASIVDQLINPGTMPDWAPDGSWVVYARHGGGPPPCIGPICGSTGVDAASIESYQYDGSMWSPGPTLVPSTGGINNYYPTISPDGEWVLFNRSRQNSYDAPDAELWVVPKAGGEPIRLDSATSSNGDSWPKWDVTVYQHQGRTLMWFTVASRRQYGLRLQAGERAQIWMGAFDPSRAGDQAYPMFWLPFQEIETGNHIAQWVTSIDRQPCTDQSMCEGGELCSEGACVPNII